jgi:hypothetical protein
MKHLVCQNQRHFGPRNVRTRAIVAGQEDTDHAFHRSMIFVMGCLRQGRAFLRCSTSSLALKALAFVV